MGNKIITISREFGSGGRVIGQALAKRLGIPCYDQALIEKIARESGLSPEYVRAQGEQADKNRWFANALSGGGYMGLSLQDKLWIIQRDIILDIAKKESCVIVGRCADFILKDHPGCIRVFIHAPLDKRLSRVSEIYRETAEASEKHILEVDKLRRAYHQLYTDQKWGHAQNYDLTLNSGKLGIDQCVALLEQLYRAF